MRVTYLAVNFVADILRVSFYMVLLVIRDGSNPEAKDSNPNPNPLKFPMDSNPDSNPSAKDSNQDSRIHREYACVPA